MTWVVAAFVASLAAFVAIGAWSATRSTATSDDYLLAGRDVPPWLAALSSVATNNSGFMFVGLIGFTYLGGVHTVWMAIAWILGDLVAWRWIHPAVRRLSGETGALSVPTLLSSTGKGAVVVLSAVLTVLYLGGYAAAQLQAGSIALERLFGWPSWVGATLGAGIVVVYCTSGGLRASIWTDAAQSVVMLASMLALVVAGQLAVGGPSGLWAGLEAQDPALVSWWPADTLTGSLLFFAGFLAGGFGAVGQPHILVRTMSVADVSAVHRARPIYFAWFIPFYLAAIVVALHARVLLPDLAAGDATVAEGALPALSLALLPDVLVGLTLAGLFAATMSTADSQVLSCSAAITEDLFPRLRGSVWAPKIATLATTALALGIALTADDGVFALVLGAWAALGATLGPLLVVRALGGRPSEAVGLAMIAVGFATVVAWPHVPGGDAVYRLLPGLLAPLALYAITSRAQLSPMHPEPP